VSARETESERREREREKKKRERREREGEREREETGEMGDSGQGMCRKKRRISRDLEASLQVEEARDSHDSERKGDGGVSEPSITTREAAVCY
jgi:RNA-binding protein 39